MSENSSAKAQETKNISLNQILLTFFSIITIRSFFDSFSYPVTNDQVFLWQHYIHGLLYFSSIFLSFTILLYFLTKAKIKSILTFLSKVSLVILLVPLVDLFLNKQKYTPLYITINASDILKTFFQLMNPLSSKGITYGIYVGAYITLGLFFYFTYKKTGNLFKSLSSMMLGYLIFFSYSILPSFFLYFNHNIISQLPSAYAYLSTLQTSWISKEYIQTSTDSIYEVVMARLFWLMIVIQIFTLLILGNKNIWNSLKKYLRLERIVNYSLIATIGIIINQEMSGDLHILNPINFLTLICFYLLIAFNAWLAVLINDPEDLKIDKISNPNRPLTNGTISTEQWSALERYVFAIFALGLLAINTESAFLLILAQCAFYIYSARPLRLKTNFIFSSLIIGATTVFVSMSGFFLVSPTAPLSSFPITAVWLIGFTYTFLSNIKDIKDYEGDKIDNIYTIPVYFGLTESKKIIAFLYAIIFISIPFFLQVQNMLLFSLCASAFTYFLMTRDYHEKYVFYTKFIYMLVLFYFIG